MVVRIRKKKNRCPGCGLPVHLCVCRLAPVLECSTEFVIVSHVKEMVRASNTARLVRLALPDTRIFLRGSRWENIPPSEFRRENGFVFLLYPSDDARIIDDAFVKAHAGPWQVVVPDGSWRQASGAVRREEGLRNLPRIKLPPGPPSRYVLRTQAFPDRVSTFEAVARVVGIIEGPEKQKLMEDYFDEMIRRNRMHTRKSIEM